MKHTVSLILVFALMGCASCVRRPKHVLSDNVMTEVFADMEIADAYCRTNQGMHGEERESLQRGILKKHHVSQEDYDSTIAWYGRNIDKYYELCDKVEVTIEKRKRKVTGSSDVEIETSDLWPYVRMAYVPTEGASNGVQFSIPTGDVEMGQRLNWKMRLFNRTEGTLIFGVEYDNGGISYKTSNVRDRKVDVTLQTDTGRTVTRIFGNIMLNMSSQRPVWIDSIALTALPYDSLEYYNIHAQRKR